MHTYPRFGFALDNVFRVDNISETSVTVADPLDLTYITKYGLAENRLTP